MKPDPADSRSFGAGTLRITGARQHVLKNVTVEIPHQALTVVTGVSGSGKSSLAMDTLFAEGQRRYLEGVSAYARRFLEQWHRPDYDTIEGLAPAVAVGQRTGHHTSRSTVGTTTEIYDYLRLLFARAGKIVCEKCGAEVVRWTIQEIAERWSQEDPQLRLMVSFPVASRRRSVARVAGDLQKKGYRRGIIEGTVVPLSDFPTARRVWHVLQDRLAAGNRKRLVEALENAFLGGEGRAGVHLPGGSAADYRLGRVCDTCDTDYPEPEPVHFSFNSPAGACQACHGFGYTLEFDPEKIVPDPGLSLEEGAIAPWAKRWRNYFRKKLESSPRARRIPRRRPWRDLGPEDQNLLLHGGVGFPGVMPFLKRLSRKSYKAGARFVVKRYQSPVLCSACGGARLGPPGRRVALSGRSLPEWCRLSVTEMRLDLTGIPLTDAERDRVGLLLEELDHRLLVLERIGLGYLSLDRLTRTLSGGEAQRIELAQALGARLVASLYVLDEPTIGLHPRDTGRLLEVLRELTDVGNTVVVVEHDRDVIQAADWMVDLGPGAGREGGDVLYCGPTKAAANETRSPTVVWLRETAPATLPLLSEPQGWIRLRNAEKHNLKGIDVDFPWGMVVGVSGVSGSGKSTLVADTLVPLVERYLKGRSEPRVNLKPPGSGQDGGREVDAEGLGRLRVDAPLSSIMVVDQAPMGRSARSIPASYVGAWDGIRALFAALPESRRRGWKPGRFSFNVAGGRCESCRGDGEVTVDMDFMADVRLRCEACDGSRFAPDVTEVRYRGHSIVDVLALTVDQAAALFLKSPPVIRSLTWLQRVGLGYLVLGQPAASLSGGEAQRLKLARELAGESRGSLVILDEPTVGLHGSEVARLNSIFRSLIASGATVLIVEHHVEMLAACDWLVELGPEGGPGGGEVVASGPPEVVVRSPESRIGPYIASRLAAGRSAVVSR